MKISMFLQTDFLVAMTVTLACSLMGKALATYPGFSLIGHLVLALLLGMSIQFFKKITTMARGGTGFIANKFLRLGIILLGFKLNLAILLSSGIQSLGFAAVIVTGMLCLTYLVCRLFNVEHTLAMLTACGCSICGAAAVMGVSAPLKAKSNDSVLAVAIVAILGTIFTLIEIGLQPVLGFSDLQFGIMAGLSLHEIAHAVAAGGVAGTVGMDNAIIAKLSRVLLLAPIALFIGFMEYRRNKDSTQEMSIPIPYFMGGFILVSAVGSYMNIPSVWIQDLVSIAYTLLGMAMAALGMNVNFDVIVQRGAKPFTAAFICSVILLGASYGIVKFLL